MTPDELRMKYQKHYPEYFDGSEVMLILESLMLRGGLTIEQAIVVIQIPELSFSVDTDKL